METPLPPQQRGMRRHLTRQDLELFPVVSPHCFLCWASDLLFMLVPFIQLNCTLNEHMKEPFIHSALFYVMENV